MDSQEMIKALNEDLSGELGAIIQYITYASKTTGPFRPQLSQLFTNEIADEQTHAQYLANKVVALGGQPTVTPRPVPAAKSNREMLEAVRSAEQQAVRDYSRRAEMASQFGDKGLQVQLENIVADETNHLEETERILREWPDIG